MASPLSLTVDASSRKLSFKGRALGLGASLLLQTAALLALGVAPLVSLDDLPEPQTSEALMQIHVVSVPAPPPAPRRASPAKPSPTRPHVPSGTVVPTVFADDILPEMDPPDLGGSETGVEGGIPFADVDVGTPEDAWTPPPPVAPPKTVEPLRVGGDITPPRKLVHVNPVYPSIAIAARVSGSVVLEAILDAEGNVVNLRVLHSIPLLDDAAVAALRQWKYEPTYLNGSPVPVVMSVNVGFVLNR